MKKPSTKGMLSEIKEDLIAMVVSGPVASCPDCLLQSSDDTIARIGRVHRDGKYFSGAALCCEAHQLCFRSQVLFLLFGLGVSFRVLTVTLPRI